MEQTAARGLGNRRWLLPGPLIVLLVSAAVFARVIPASGELAGAAGMIVGYVVAGSLILRRSRSLERRERVGWLFLAASMLLAAVGVLVVGVLTESGFDVPAFGPLDVFFLASYATLVSGLYRLARAEGEGRDWLPTILDALVGAVALAALVWNAFFQELVDNFQGVPWWEMAIAVTYPIFDVAAVIGLMILVIRRSHYHLDLRLMFLALGGSLQVLADFSFLSSGVGGSFEEAQPNFVLLLLAAACLLTTAAIVDKTPRKREFPEHATPIWALVWPYLLAGSLLGAHLVRYRSLNPENGEMLLLDAVILIGVIVFFRQVLAIRRNRIRVENQRSELVASVSHELRTPLTAMVGYLSLLDEEGDEFAEDATREMISEATGQARYMARLVSDLVMLARGSDRHVELTPEAVPVSSIVADSLESVDSEDTKIEQDLAGDVRVRVDPDRMQQAVVNLLSNAVRYGGDRALLAARVEGEDLVVDVHDNGEGVPTRYETAIWQRFDRGAHRLDAATPGLGIGLAIVEAIAESHGGSASYRRSERLGGACFTLVIPNCLVDNRTQSIKVEVAS